MLRLAWAGEAGWGRGHQGRRSYKLAPCCCDCSTRIHKQLDCVAWLVAKQVYQSCQHFTFIIPPLLCTSKESGPPLQLQLTSIKRCMCLAYRYALPEPQVERAVQDALALVNMSDFMHRPTHTLSGGQRQRVAIAGWWLTIAHRNTLC